MQLMARACHFRRQLRPIVAATRDRCERGSSARRVQNTPKRGSQASKRHDKQTSSARMLALHTSAMTHRRHPEERLRKRRDARQRFASQHSVASRRAACCCWPEPRRRCLRACVASLDLRVFGCPQRLQRGEVIEHGSEAQLLLSETPDVCVHVYAFLLDVASSVHVACSLALWDHGRPSRPLAWCARRVVPSCSGWAHPLVARTGGTSRWRRDCRMSEWCSGSQGWDLSDVKDMNINVGREVAQHALSRTTGGREASCGIGAPSLPSASGGRTRVPRTLLPMACALPLLVRR